MRNKLYIFAVLRALLASFIAAVLILITCGDFAFLIKEYYTAADFNITEEKSQYDADGDGIDDRTDLLLSARNYIETKKPKYKSKYYVGGYPNDKYGVCTDVVAFASLDTGYDLRKLVAEDIAARRKAYKIKYPDDNIDFRRVTNLTAYYKKHAITLTTDIRDISAWQSGDIVVFHEHIGIVSDRRNARGIPFVIHHSGSPQLWYEEDILEAREKNKDILHHFRLK